MTEPNTRPVQFCREQNGCRTNGFTKEDKNLEENARLIEMLEILTCENNLKINFRKRKFVHYFLKFILTQSQIVNF